MSTSTTAIKTENKLVPELRFKGLKDDWQSLNLNQLIKDLQSGISVNSEDRAIIDASEFGILKTSAIANGVFKEGENKKIVDKEISRAKLNPTENEIIISRMNTPQLVGESGYISKTYPNLFIPDRLWQTITYPKKCNNRWLSYFLITDRVRYSLKSMATGTSGTMKNISKPNFLGIKVTCPSLPEQQKIASFLSAVDQKIQQLTTKKELLEQYKKGVMQQLFSGQLRFKDENGNDYPDWKLRKMTDILFEHKLKSTGAEEVFSVSVHKGLVNQVEHLGRVFAAKNTDNYNLVQPGDIVYTKSPTGSFPLGIIKQSKIDKNVIVSPLYGIFAPETEGLGYMLNVFFESPINVKNYLASIIQKGAKNTINITNTTFLSKKMKLPVSKKEQNRIGIFLKEIDVKIAESNNQITQTQTFKKGLLQQLFV